MSKKYFYIAVYEIDMAYGGPEEGGWWYNTGNLERIMKRTRSEALAEKLCRRVNDRLYHNKKRLHISVSSVAYSGGAYNAEIFDCDPPKYYPEERPHYE